MRLLIRLSQLCPVLLLLGCIHPGPNPADPYESVNRKIFAFNRALDKVVLKPPARLYKAVVPFAIRRSVNNFYLNIYMIPTVANDLLQANWRAASDDAGRFVINSTLGFGGLFDVATNYHLPFHQTDLGLTFAHWGDKESPYVMLPFLGPSTIRDTWGMAFEYTFLTPYPYLASSVLLTDVLLFRYVDLRSQLLETERLFNEALDKYSFLRDAWLQNRHFLIYGEAAVADDQGDALYVEEEGEDYVDEDPSDA